MTISSAGCRPHGTDGHQRRARPAGGPSAWGVGTRVGVELLSALVVGVGIGWALDRWLHTSPLFLVVFVLLGGAAGWRTCGA